MAGNNRITVWNMDTARGIVQWLGGALAIAAIAWKVVTGRWARRVCACRSL